MEIIKIEASSRTERGKSPATRLRREGKIPAIAYGRTLAATPIAISPASLLTVLNSAHGKNAVVELGVDGGKQTITALVREYTYHPLTRALLHADFVEVKLDQPVDVEVPFVLKGKAPGVVLGGVLRQVFRAIPIRCLPEKIPTSLEADVSHLELGGHIKASELKLPEGVSVRLPAEQTVAGVVAPEKEKAEDVAAAAPGAPGAPAAAGAAPAAGAAAAPAKDAKAAAPAKDAKKK